MRVPTRVAGSGSIRFAAARGSVPSTLVWVPSHWQRGDDEPQALAETGPLLDRYITPGAGVALGVVRAASNLPYSTTVWFEVRILRGPPGSPRNTESSRRRVNSP